MKDMLRVDISVEEGQYREATGLVRFDDDPTGHFFGLVDSNIGALTDQITAAVRSVLARSNPGVVFEVQTQAWHTPMTERGRYARGLTGEPVPGKKRGRKPGTAR